MMKRVRCENVPFFHTEKLPKKETLCYNGPRKKRQVRDMPFEIVRNDIVQMRVDAIVNTANPRAVVGSGTDAAIHAAAGPELLEARKKIGRIAVGQAAVTPGFGLDAKYVIHTVGPVWRGGLFGEAKLLHSCYESALKLAVEHGCRSVAFPLISTGNYAFPKEKALQIAISVFGEFLMEQEMQIYLVVFDRNAFRLSEKLFYSVSSYIDEHYVEEKAAKEYAAEYSRFSPYSRDRELDAEMLPERGRGWKPERAAEPKCCAAMPAPMEPYAPGLSLDKLLAEVDAGFSETLLKLIDKSGKKDSYIYKKANISKQHFSKIRNNPAYQPTKPTAIALALALELDLEQTRDLIGRAGYALTNSSKFDVIICYFIERKIYDVMEINLALYEFDQSLLGA